MPPDAVPPDAVPPDAVPPDAVLPDAVASDTEVPDVEVPDAGVPDVAVPSNTEVPDVAAPDAAPWDALVPDAAPLTWWRPAAGSTWHIQFVDDLDEDRDVDLYVVDLFDTPTDAIGRLRSDGRAVVCYISAGSREDWRPDADRFPAVAVGSPLDPWPGEHWLDIRDAGVRSVLLDRMDLAVEKGCDGLDPDNVDAYTHPTGFDFGADDQIEFNRWLADNAHRRGLGIGLKNDLGQIRALVDHFDWSIDEQCVEYAECGRLAPFIEAGKPVLHIEYADDVEAGPTRAAEICALTTPMGFSTVIKDWDLSAWSLDCAGWSSPPDAALPDAALPDAALPDAALPDAGEPHVGEPDAGIPDAAPDLDGGVADDWWRPGPGVTWQWQLTEDLEFGFDVEMYDIDLFEVTEDEIRQLRSAGRVVICYFSAGSREDWRPDADDFPAAGIGQPLGGWPGEHWLDIRSPGVRAVHAARLDLAAAKGCDGVEPDNVDGYSNPNGFDLRAADQLDFNRWLADEAHARGLSVGLKNDVEQVAALVDDFDWAMNEECLEYDECDALRPFIAAGKAVFHVEYVDGPNQGPARAETVCPQTAPLGFSTLIKTWDLVAWRLACDVVPPTRWVPDPGASWHRQHSTPIDESVDAEVRIVDLFDIESEVVARLAAQGRAVVCAFSAGTWEDWRSDAGAFPAEALGVDSWPGERWLDVRHSAVRDAMAARLDLAVTKGCAGVEPYNVDGYLAVTGFPLDAGDQLDFDRWLAAQAHARSLGVALAGDPDQAATLVGDFDWAVVNECVEFDECDRWASFAGAGKAIFHAEYVDAPADGAARAAEVCPLVPAGFSTLIRAWSDDVWYLACGDDPSPPDAGISDAGISDAGVADAAAPDAAPDAALPPRWVPEPGDSWHRQDSTPIDENIDVDVRVVDLFDAAPEAMARLAAAGRAVVCAFSAGTRENWRPDSGDYPPAAIGNAVGAWPGEHWLDIRDLDVRALMATRLDLAAEKGCAGVLPDNVDGYATATGFPLSAEDQIDFDRWLAGAARARGLAVALSGDLDQVEALEPAFDWAVVHECLEYEECDRLASFVDADKAVFHAEYVDEPSAGAARAAEICPAAPAGFSTQIRAWSDDLWFLPCDGEGTADAGVPDAAVPDAAVPDAAVPDAAVPDAAVPDAAVPDAAVPDAAVPDAAVPDADAPDAAPPPLWWRPQPGATWQWQLTLPIDTAVDAEAFVVDLFDTPDDAIAALHDLGRIVVCQFSAGTREIWRGDADDFPAETRGLPIAGDDEEVFVDIRDPRVVAVALARLDVAVARGCDAVAPSNIDLHAQITGFDITSADQLAFNDAIADAAHIRVLSVGLVNGLEQAAALAEVFDWAMNLQCFQYDECGMLSPFIDADRAVFHVEFVGAEADGPAAVEAICPSTTTLGLSTIVKRHALDAWRLPCP